MSDPSPLTAASVNHPDWCGCVACKAAATAEQPAHDPFALVPVGKHRDGDALPYGTVAPRVREELARSGVVEAHQFAKRTGLPWNGVAGALKREVAARRAEFVFRGVIARPDVAQAIREAVTKAVAS